MSEKQVINLVWPYHWLANLDFSASRLLSLQRCPDAAAWTLVRK